MSGGRVEIDRGIRTVDGDADEVAELLELAAGQAQRTEIPENQVVIGTLGLQLVATGNELLAESLRVGDDLLRVRLPCWLRRLKESSSDAGNGIVVGTTLASGEDSVVDALLEVLGLVGVFAEENQTSTGTTKGLMSARPSVRDVTYTAC